MSIRDTFAKAAGLFIESSPKGAPVSADDALSQLQEMDAPAKTVEHIVREAPGPDLAEIKVPETTTAPAAPIFQNGNLNFVTLYQQAGLPPASFSAEQTLDLIATIPKDYTLDAKRQTVKVMLNAMGKTLGATPETIVTDASRKLATLNAYVDHLGKLVESTAATEEAAIAEMQARIAEKRKAIDAARQQQAQITQLCHNEADRLDDVLEFFSLDVPPSKYAPPTQDKK